MKLQEQVLSELSLSEFCQKQIEEETAVLTFFNNKPHIDVLKVQREL